MSKNYHALLQRQLHRQGVAAPLTDECAKLADAVHEAYKAFESDHALLERSLELSSRDLLQVNAELRAVLQAFPDVFMWLAHDGTIREIQSQGDGSLLRSREHMLGKRIQNTPDEMVAIQFASALERLQETGEDSTFEYTLYFSGQERRFEARLLPTVMGQVLAILRDVSEKHRSEEERHRHSKLDSVGLLAGGIAHDFNNILSAISAGLSLAQFEMEEENEEVSKLLRETEMAVRRGSSLTKQLLTFSRGGAPVRATASIAEILHESARFALRGSSVVVEVDAAAGLSAVEIDQGQISQVANNLVINANQAMPDGGRLTIRARNMERPDSSQPHWIQIQVIDEGCGIKSENLDRIFDPYFTTKMPSATPGGTLGGNGLGLATSYSIIRKHGGEMRVESTVGVGTTFEILLPASENSLPIEKPMGPKEQMGRGRVLLVDDELPILKLGSRMLQSLGYKVETAPDGGVAFQLFDAGLRESKPFDVVILDLTIPGGMGGQETAMYLRVRAPDCLFVASSGYSNNPVMSDHQAYDFDAVLPKPYGRTELGELLRSILST